MLANATRWSLGRGRNLVPLRSQATAGVPDVNGGTRLLRHNAASRLLRAAVPLPTISAVLGHASPDSTDVYLCVDRDRLLECVLAIPGGQAPRS